jgi:hypothetical protein
MKKKISKQYKKNRTQQIKKKMKINKMKNKNKIRNH